MKILKRAFACFVIVLFITAVVWGAWDKDKPAAGTSLRSSNPELLANQSALQTALDAEHDFGSSTQTGSHTPGSARAFFQDAAPSTQIDGGAFAATDLGSLWFDTNATPDNLYYVLTATTPTWTLISTSLIAEVVATANTWGAHQTFGAGFDLLGSATSDITWNTDKFTVAGATGDVVIAGTLDVTGNIDPTTYDPCNGGFLDEDDMTSDAADKVASQQSIKAFGTWVPAVTGAGAGYAGEESITSPNGLIIKMGYQAVGAASGTITFGTAFPTGVVGLSTTLKHTAYTTASLTIQDFTTVDIDWTTLVDMTGFWWVAVGY